MIDRGPGVNYREPKKQTIVLPELSPIEKKVEPQIKVEAKEENPLDYSLYFDEIKDLHPKGKLLYGTNISRYTREEFSSIQEEQNPPASFVSILSPLFQVLIVIVVFQWVAVPLVNGTGMYREGGLLFTVMTMMFPIILLVGMANILLAIAGAPLLGVEE